MRKPIIMQKTGNDCMIASLAMLLEISYEHMAEFFPPLAVKEKGYRFEWLVPWLANNHIRLVWIDPDSMDIDWSIPCVLDVPSVSRPESYDHIIYWNGKNVVDPSFYQDKYYSKPEKINNIYQVHPTYQKIKDTIFKDIE